MSETDVRLTVGEAAVLVGQLAGLPAEDIGGWTVILQRRTVGDIAIVSSAISAEHGVMVHEVLFMLLDAAREVADQVRSS